MLMVLLMLSVMLLGGLALARITEIGTLAAGNGSYREASLQASEVGINTAFAEIKALANENVTSGSWYWPTMQTADSSGIPQITWSAAPSVAVGGYTVSYAVERMCTVAVVTNTERECLLKQDPNPGSSSRVGQEELAPPNARQFRITVRVTGPKDTETWVQSLVTRG